MDLEKEKSGQVLQQPPMQAPQQMQYVPVMYYMPQTAPLAPTSTNNSLDTSSFISNSSQPKGRQQNSSDDLNKFVVVSEGRISLSLRDLTFYMCIVTTATLLGMLYKACDDQLVYCDLPSLRVPYISDVLCLPLYDRITCILFTFFMFTVFQPHVRAFYHRLTGIASESQNTWMLITGLLATVALPGIGYFDEHNYTTIHVTLAGIFFASVGVYSYILSRVLCDNKTAFPESLWSRIHRARHVKNLMWICLITFLIALVLGGGDYWLVTVMEWCSTLLFLNYFGIISFLDDYYDTVVRVPDQQTFKQ